MHYETCRTCGGGCVAGVDSSSGQYVPCPSCIGSGRVAVLTADERRRADEAQRHHEFVEWMVWACVAVMACGVFAGFCLYAAVLTAIPATEAMRPGGSVAFAAAGLIAAATVCARSRRLRVGLVSILRGIGCLLLLLLCGAVVLGGLALLGSYKR